MLGMTKRWYVPVYSKNVTKVPKTLEKFGITYDKFSVVDESNKEVIGFVFKFDCVPLAYTGIKMMCEGSNNFTPLEVTLGGK